MRESKWFKEGQEAAKACAADNKLGVVCPYGARSAKALIWDEGFKTAVREQVVDSTAPVA